MLTICTEYLRSVLRNYCPVEFFLQHFFVHLMIQHERLYQLHQMLQYHILSDSLPLAELLITISDQYQPAYQLALDMLYRLRNLKRILELLLERDQVLDALRLVPSNSEVFLEEGLQPRYFLRSASELSPNVFFAVFKYFEDRNIALRYAPDFLPEDQCDGYVEKFKLFFESE
eukprot:TRINITY_DN13127_c0_g1_i4.p1 TRINITY_DN13127_c0_g1~~TRINITY_DN13127_c0_g1_i4.p1  ORF type:complete len:173 (-),score=24.79 TRINITY_DN13127_c0_g1_i4:14-532(-)